MAKRFHIDDKNKTKQSKELEALKELLDLIERGTTGFDLAYHFEKSDSLPRLYHDGIFFNITFKKVGKEPFIDAPDKKKVEFTSFSTVEESEKAKFMKWIKKAIQERERVVNPLDDYSKYKEAREVEVLPLKSAYCEFCGIKLRDPNQNFCESCGAEISRKD